MPYPVAREARVKFYGHAHLVSNHVQNDRDCYRNFLDEKINCKSNGIDLEAIEAYSLIVTAAETSWIGSHCAIVNNSKVKFS